jgi:hypothetical protein
MKRLLEEACSEKLAQCGFKICKTNPADAEDIPWYEKELGCSEFLAELKSRFGGGKRPSELPPEKREELNNVLALSCSERFQHCNFTACRKAPPSAPQR